MSPMRRNLSVCSFLIFCFSCAGALGGTWFPVARTAPGAVELMLLLSDGTVMCANNDDMTIGNAWFRLTPDSHGSYTNGTWTTLAPMNYTRLFYSSAVLQDGRVFVAGGEYGTGTATAEVYDPRSNVWTVATIPAALLDPSKLSPIFSPMQNIHQGFLDSQSKILANGNVLVSPVAPNAYGGTLIYNSVSNTWSAGPPLYQAAYQDEATWVKLPDDSILTVDPFANNSERYIPSLNQWISDATVPVTLYSSPGELGPALLLPDGRAFFIGGTGRTAFYTPSGSTAPGTWAAGPSIPNGLGVCDGPAAMMVNGKILCAAGSVTTFNPPTSFFEFDPVANTFTAVSAPPISSGVAPYQNTMLDLPDGSVLLSSCTSQLYIYQPTGSPLAAGKPTVTSVRVNVDGSYPLTGTLLNGISEGAAYGDDAQMSGNYPLVRLTNAAGTVYYARTYNWSSTGVMTGSTPKTTEFTLPPALPSGLYSLVVTANGISSDPVIVQLPATAQPFIQSIVNTNRAARLTWTSQYGLSYQALYNTNLLQTNWFNLGNPIIAASPTASLSDPLQNGPRFYRIKLLP